MSSDAPYRACPSGFDTTETNGYDVDWAHRLAEVLGVELEIVDVNGDTRIPAVTSTVDCILQYYWQPDPAQTIDFSIPYLAQESKC